MRLPVPEDGMMDPRGLVGGEVPGTAVIPGIFTEDPPARPRAWFCQHCGTRNEGRVLASYNGAPLCNPDCYRRVKEFDHQMPCEEVPCPGDVPMTHEHDEGEDQ